MTEKELESYLYKDIRIICTDGDVLEGYAYYFADSEDMNPEKQVLRLKMRND